MAAVDNVTSSNWVEIHDFLLSIILYQLPHKSMFRAAQVCKRWNDIVQTLVSAETYWKALCDSRCPDIKAVATALKISPETPPQTLYRTLFVNHLRGMQQGVSLMKDPYIGPPYHTRHWSCNTCDRSSDFIVYHCSVCGVYDMCTECYKSGKRAKHDCVKMTNWWTTNYRKFTWTKPAPVDVTKLLQVRRGIGSEHMCNFPVSINMNFSDPGENVVDEIADPNQTMAANAMPARFYFSFNSAGDAGDASDDDDDADDEPNNP